MIRACSARLGLSQSTGDSDTLAGQCRVFTEIVRLARVTTVIDDLRLESTEIDDKTELSKTAPERKKRKREKRKDSSVRVTEMREEKRRDSRRDEVEGGQTPECVDSKRLRVCVQDASREHPENARMFDSSRGFCRRYAVQQQQRVLWDLQPGVAREVVNRVQVGCPSSDPRVTSATADKRGAVAKKSQHQAISVIGEIWVHGQVYLVPACEIGIEDGGSQRGVPCQGCQAHDHR